MDTILQGIPNVICYIDDILVTTGPDDMTHLQNLQEVLRRLGKHGVRLKLAKCLFWKESVEYLGHLVSSQGLMPEDSKKEAIVNSHEPQNIQQMKSYLELLNYYANLFRTCLPLSTP